MSKKVIFFVMMTGVSIWVNAQIETPVLDTVNNPIAVRRGVTKDTAYSSGTYGEFTPGKGFDLVKSKYGSLNISIYGMIRYLNQMPGEQTYQDHLGRDRNLTGRNDIYWHRSMIWFSGFIGVPKLTYTVTVWSIMSTQQTLIYGNVQYRFNKHLRVGIGMVPNLSIRSMQGPFPYYSSTDRTMGEEALRGGFTNGLFLTGEITPRLFYNFTLGNNLSQLGVNAAKLTRDMSKSFSLTWLPTTGEFGPRGGIGDFEHHEKLATRFGASYCQSREDRFNNIGEPSPDNTQVRLSDGVLFFEQGALGDGITVDNADYNMIAVDMGFKYKGFSVQGEFYSRKLSKFESTSPLPINKIVDNGYSLQIGYMVLPRLLNAYLINSYFWDEFKRNPWEIGGGVNFYPLKSRSFRVNGQLMHVSKSAAGGTFGLYTGGQTGSTLTVGVDFML